MKSRLRTCSRGTACNFIHCFRNPGGDYEWADWDNPPPKYWMKKMAFLFGPDEGTYGEQMNMEELEGPWYSNRQKTPTSYRHQTRRSIHTEMDMHNTDSRREDTDEKMDSRSPRKDHSSKRRKGTYYLHEHDRFEEKKRRIHSPYDDSYNDPDAYFLKKYPNNGQKNIFEDGKASKKHKGEEELCRQKGSVTFHNQGKVKKRRTSEPDRLPNKGSRSSERFSDDTDDNEERRNTASSEASYGKHGIDVKERYDGGSADLCSEKKYHEKTSRRSKYHDERTECDLYSSRRRKSHASHENKLDSKRKRVRKQKSSDREFSSDGCGDGMKTTDINLDCEATSLSGDQHNLSHGKHKSVRKRKSRRKEEEYSTAREPSASSDSDNMESNSSRYKKHSRSGTPAHSPVSSRKRSHGISKE